MTELTQDLSLAQAHSLIESYAFDLGEDDAQKLLASWLDIYQASWIRLATIEALYLGRYKTISIEHILSVWLRLGTPNTHFTYEFERLICRKLPKHLSDLSQLTVNLATREANLVENSPETVNPTWVSSDRSTHSTIVEEDNLNLASTLTCDRPEKNNLSLISALGLPYQPDWSEFTRGNKMIHQFIPLPDVSSFFHKLKTFGEERLES